MLGLYMAFPDSSVEESACHAEDAGLIAGSGRSAGEGIGYPLQYSDLENSQECIAGHNGMTFTFTFFQIYIYKLKFRFFLILEYN